MALRERWRRFVDGTFDDDDLYLTEGEQTTVKWVMVGVMLFIGVTVAQMERAWFVFIWGFVTGFLVLVPKGYFR